MSNVINFRDALLNKRDDEFETRQVISKKFVKAALKAARKTEDEINQAIFNAEVAMAAWRCKNLK